jgi:hypothetical protein
VEETEPCITKIELKNEDTRPSDAENFILTLICTWHMDSRWYIITLWHQGLCSA